MQPLIAGHVTLSRRVAGLVVVPLAALAVSACGSSSHPRSAGPIDPAPPVNGTQVQSSTVVSSGSDGAAATSKSVTMTTAAGYVYGARLASAGVVAMTSFTTDDGSGLGGTPVDVPPGSKLLAAQIVFSNRSDRPEPLIDAPIGVMPADGSGSGVTMVVPQADAAAFGIDPSAGNGVCNAGSDPTAADLPPAGYCHLPVQIGAFSPAQSDVTQPPQLAAGAAGTVTFVTAPGITGSWVPQNAPVEDVKVFATPNPTCNCWTPLS